MMQQIPIEDMKIPIYSINKEQQIYRRNKSNYIVEATIQKSLILNRSETNLACSGSKIELAWLEKGG